MFLLEKAMKKGRSLMFLVIGSSSEGVVEQITGVKDQADLPATQSVAKEYGMKQHTSQVSSSRQ